MWYAIAYPVSQWLGWLAITVESDTLFDLSGRLELWADEHA